jgi:hypothetical protein
MTKRTLDELIANAERLADEFEDYDPEAEDFGAPMSPIMAVKLAAFRRSRAEKDLADAVAAARDADISWRKLGEAIGTSGEAVRQRYSRRAS